MNNEPAHDRHSRGQPLEVLPPTSARPFLHAVLPTAIALLSGIASDAQRRLLCTDITEIQNLLTNSKVRNVIHSGRITFRVLTNYIPRLGELQSAVMANYNPRSQARPTP
jgi:hypothetical protein